MHKTMMLGVMLLGILSGCKPPTIKEPLNMYAINLDFQEAGKGLKNLNIRDDASLVGEWVNEVVFMPLEDSPNNLMCFSMEDWLLKVRPKLKEGARYYRDSK